MLTIARGTSGADSVEPIAVIRLSLKPALLSPISAENISIQWIVRFDAYSVVDARAQFLLATEVPPVNTGLAGSVIMPVFR